MDYTVLLTGFVIMGARILDVSLGTIRTIVTVQGRSVLAFILGFFEVSIWLSVTSTVIHKVTESPILIVFFALGFALGNVVGIMVERKIALGPIILKLITTDVSKDKIIKTAKDLSLDVTMIEGMGMRGPVSEIYTVCRRKDLKQILPIVRQIDPNIFYVTEQVRDVSRTLRPVYIPITGWRSVLKKK